jgi:hypothetical protein
MRDRAILCVLAAIVFVSLAAAVTILLLNPEAGDHFLRR